MTSPDTSKRQPRVFRKPVSGTASETSCGDVDYAKAYRDVQKCLDSVSFSAAIDIEKLARTPKFAAAVDYAVGQVKSTKNLTPLISLLGRVRNSRAFKPVLLCACAGATLDFALAADLSSIRLKRMKGICPSRGPSLEKYLNEMPGTEWDVVRPLRAKFFCARSAKLVAPKDKAPPPDIYENYNRLTGSYGSKSK